MWSPYKISILPRVLPYFMRPRILPFMPAIILHLNPFVHLGLALIPHISVSYHHFVSSLAVDQHLIFLCFPSNLLELSFPCCISPNSFRSNQFLDFSSHLFSHILVRDSLLSFILLRLLLQILFLTPFLFDSLLN